ncbi:MAG: hypothetical protein E7Z91_02290 [Cyanobacteria bacterium SIG30]|nr:hypothetical protein [Cyanobacteria bacterium SIG30]
MLNFLNKREENYTFLDEIDLNALFNSLKYLYDCDSVTDERKEYLKEMIETYGYLPYPHFQTLSELTRGEIIYTLEQKLTKENIIQNGHFVSFKNPSPLARLGIKNPNWFKKEGHNIKLITLAALKNGAKTEETGKFIDWIAQLITLPVGNIKQGVMPTTIYLTPIHPRDFECAYLPKSSEISEKIKDEKLEQFLNLDAEKQVKLFITLAQLAGHPVIYDVLPQTGRFSKMVLANPSIARWFNINELIIKNKEFAENIFEKLKKTRKFKVEDIDKALKAYLQVLRGSTRKYTEIQKKIIEKVEEELKEYKILSSYKMSFKDKQKEIVQYVEGIIEEANGLKPKCEDDIKKQDKIIKALINVGCWPAPGGAWCSAGVPIFDKMSPKREYPIFKHYNFKGEDVTHFANLDCQTPFFFTYFEKERFNGDVINFYVNYVKDLCKKFNFDGIRVDHVDHIVDDFSVRKDSPISYRAPSYVLNKVNETLRKEKPYFATLAEYMLWDDFYIEYHKGMSFDVLWGNDIVSQNSKTPKQIIEDNEKLEAYNKKFAGKRPLSILKTYNNQDGEFEAIDQYPGQLGEAGALFKWFKYKFLPGGKFANRPSLFVDGDESFTKTGIERIIGKETSMVRGENWNFFEKFDALNRFVENNPIILNGKAKLLEFEEDGFSAWEIIEDKNEESLLVVVNYKAPSEKLDVKMEDGTTKRQVVKGKTIYDNIVEIDDNKKIVSYYEFEYDKNQKCTFVPKPLIDEIYSSIHFNILQPSEFKVYKLIKTNSKKKKK